MNLISKYRSFSIFYLTIVIANLLFFTHLTEYKIVSKPMIMASLIGFYISNAKQQSNSFLLALILALLGDIFLMFTSDDFFLIGLGCFLIMQILYGINFLKDKSNEVKKIIISIVLVLIVAIFTLYSLWDGLLDFRIPVSLYTSAISFMVIAATIRKTNINWYFQLVVGVVLFLISDAFIAFSKFGIGFTGIEYAIILTYMIAQYLIVRGMIENQNQSSK